MSYYCHYFSKESLNKLYELLADVTPLPYVCGVLCGAACCKGSDRDGMILFPGERRFFEDLPGFSVWHNAEYDYDYLVCSGSCDREERPLSCRIFPYFFYVTRDEVVRAAPDIRALGHCQLLKDRVPIDRAFLRRMRMCAKVIRADGELYDFVRRLTIAFTDFGPLN